MKRVVILGGGSGGLVSANKVKKLLGDRVEVIVVDRNAYHDFQPSYPWVALGFKEPDDVRRPLKLLERKSIRFLNDEVVSIEPENDKVILKDHGKLTYDYLVVSLGAEIDYDALEGYDKHKVHHTWTLNGALRFREAIKDFKGGRIVIGVSGIYYKCPPAPFELAGQLDFVLKAKGIRKKTDITVFHVTEGPLSNMGPAISTTISEILERKSINFVGNFEAVRIDDTLKRIYSKDGRYLEYDLLVLVPPHKVNSVVSRSSLCKDGNFPLVDPSTFRSKFYENVFVIGDVVNPLLNLPPAGVVAHFQAEFIASQIATEVKGAYVGESFTPVAMCVMDFGDDAVLPMCEFSRFYEKLSAPPVCGVLGKGKEIRLVKMIFESMWFATYLTR